MTLGQSVWFWRGRFLWRKSGAAVPLCKKPHHLAAGHFAERPLFHNLPTNPLAEDTGDHPHAAAVFHHFLYGFQMPDGAGKAVEHGLGVFMNVGMAASAVRVRDPLRVQIGVAVERFVFHGF